MLPQPTPPPPPPPPGTQGMRLAPGYSLPFYPNARYEGSEKRPWILVSGDQAGKVWMMKPKDNDFEYEDAVVFDINDYYGPGTTQTFTSEGFTISAIGQPGLFYDEINTKCKKKEHSSSNGEAKHGLKGSKTKHASTLKGSKTERKSMSNRTKEKNRSKSKGSKRVLEGRMLRHGFLRRASKRKECKSRAAVIYIPVFEAREIHVLSFDGDQDEKLTAPPMLHFTALPALSTPFGIAKVFLVLHTDGTLSGRKRN